MRGLPDKRGGARERDVGGPTLLAMLSDFSRALTGLRAEREIYDAAMAIIARSRARGMVLTQAPGEPRVEVSSQSIGGVLSQTLRELSGQQGGSFRFDLGGSGTLRKALAGLPAQSMPVSGLAEELFGPTHGPRVEGLLGGDGGRAAIAPIHCGHAVVAALLLTAPPTEPDLEHGCDTIAAAIGAALTFARVLRRIDRLRTMLPAEHAARRTLRDATENDEIRMSAGHFFVPGRPADASLVPYRLTRTTAPPPGQSQVASGPARSGAHLERESAGEATDARATILLVEDDRRLRESTAALLSGLGYQVETVASGEEAVTAYSRAREAGSSSFDLVLLDQTLGGQMRGSETLRILQSIQHPVRAILLSGLADKTPMAELRRQGFVDRLNKPVAMEALNTAIERALSSGQ